MVAKTRLRVTMIGTLPPWRGVAPYTSHLVEALEQEPEIDLEFVDFKSLYPRRLYPGGEPAMGGTTPGLGRTRHRRILRWYNPLSWLWAGLTLRGSVVHAQWWTYALAPVYLAVLGIARLRKRTVVLTVHNVAPHDATLWQRALYRSVFRFADHFIVHSERNVRTLLRTYPAAWGRVTVIPHGLLTAPRTAGLTKRDARRALRLPGKRPVILAFGNLRPYKGIDVLVRALRRLHGNGQDALLLIAGEPWGSFEGHQRLIERLALSDHVRTRLEYILEDEVEAYFRAADVAAFPYTDFAAQSGAAALALSFGVPMVVSDVGGLPDSVADPRAVVPPADADALADALAAVLSDRSLRTKLRNDARRLARQLDWSLIAAQTAECYGALAGEPVEHEVADGTDKQVA